MLKLFSEQFLGNSIASIHDNVIARNLRCPSLYQAKQVMIFCLEGNWRKEPLAIRPIGQYSPFIIRHSFPFVDLRARKLDIDRERP